MNSCCVFAGCVCLRVVCWWCSLSLTAKRPLWRTPLKRHALGCDNVAMLYMHMCRTTPGLEINLEVRIKAIIIELEIVPH